MAAITFQKATKAQAKARIAIDGPSGAGKTWTSLEVASQFGGRILLIDQEKGSGALYADQFNYDYYRIDAPYHPQRCVEVLQAAQEQGYDVVIVDSLSHFWDGAGGTLEIVDAAAQREFRGNSYAGWSIGTPALRSLVDALLDLDAHLIVTMRSKMEYVLETGANGKQTPRKVGMAPVMRNGVEYEFTIVGDMDLDHRIVISKSRCSALADKVIQPHHAKDMAVTFKQWLESGEPMIGREDVDTIGAIFATITDPETRSAKKAAFVDAFDKPERLFARQVDEATAFARELAGLKNASEREEGVGQSAAEEPLPTPAEEEANFRAKTLLDVETAIRGLPTSRQAACREVLRQTYGDLGACHIDRLCEAIELVEAFPISEPIHTGDPANLPSAATGERPLNAKQRELIAYGRNAGLSRAQLVALASLLYETTEPRPLHELNDMGVLEVKRMVDRVEAKEIVFETPNGVLIAKEVAPV